MKFDKIDITVEKLGDITIFSYDGYILGFRDWNSSEYISFCPITVNNENIDILDVYLEFIDTCCANNSDGIYPSDYRVCFNYYLKDYYDLCSSEVIDLIKSMPDDNAYVELGDSFILGEYVFALMRQVSCLDKDISFDFSNNLVLSLDEDNYIEVQIDCCNQHSFISNSTTKRMDDVVNVFKHFFEMLDKNLNW